MSAESLPVATHMTEQVRIKRKRISIACTTCRARKTKCDGARPKCETCVQMEEECAYIQPPPNSEAQTHNARQSSELVQRLDKLEAAMRAPTESNDLGPQRRSLGISPRRRFSGADSLPLPGDESLLSTANFTSNPRLPAEIDHSTYQEDNTDGLAAVAAFSDDDAHLDNSEGPYYGPSSNITLTKQISSALLRTKGVREWHQTRVFSDERRRNKSYVFPTSERTTSTEYIRDYDRDIYEIPPALEAQAYISHFFTQVALFLSSLHQKSFLETFRYHSANLLQGRLGSVSKVWIGILNLVFAISRTTMEGNSPDISKLAASEVFYQRAMKLGWEKALRGRSVEIIQFLHLKSTFLQGAERPLDVWATHSLAVNAAYSIGLHTTQSNNALSLLEKEIRMRTWYCLLIDDQTLSAAWGRPALTAGMGYQSITSIKEDSGFYPANVPKHLSALISSYLTSTVSLGFICQDTINELYNHNQHTEKALGLYDTVSRASEICWKLNIWKESLPAALRPPTRDETLSWNDGRDLHVTRLRYFLLLRYHYQRILAYRAVLGRFLDEFPASIDSEEAYEPLRRNGLGLLQDCAHCCATIIDVVQLVVRASEEHITLNGAWWQCSYYVFNASLVLCGIILSVMKQTEGSSLVEGKLFEDAREAFRRGLKVMEDLDRGSAIISRCRNVLNRFSELLNLSCIYEQQIIGLERTVISDQTVDNMFQAQSNNAGVGQAASFNNPQTFGAERILADQALGRGAAEFELDGLEYVLENWVSEDDSLNFI